MRRLSVTLMGIFQMTKVIKYKVSRVIKEEIGEVDFDTLDSLDLLEIQMALEEEFRLNIPEDSVSDWASIYDIVDTIASLLNPKSVQLSPVDELALYREAINKIDDYFEYSMESKRDQHKVRSILAELTEGLKGE